MPATTRRQSGKVVPTVKMVPTTVSVVASAPAKHSNVVTRTATKRKAIRKSTAAGKTAAKAATVMDVDGSDLSALSASEDESFQEEDEIWEEEDEEVEEEDESDYGDEPASKRRKTVDNSSKSSKGKSRNKQPVKSKGPSRRVQGRLQNMLEMPMDVLFLIFYDLLPQDLLNLSRTSKNLRAVLMSRNAVSVWKTSRTNVPGPPTPAPPSDLSEPAWAHLLYGGAVCWSCKAKNIHRIDFALRRRMCTHCMKQNLVYASKFGSKCPDLDQSLMDFLPYTHTGGWAHGHSSNSRFYWRPDLYTMNTKVARLQKNIKLNTPGARKAYDEFRKEKVLYVDSIMQGVDIYEKWVRDSEISKGNEREDKIDKRYNDIVNRLIDLGYEEEEMTNYSFQRLSTVRIDREITDASWKKIRPSLEQWLKDERARKYDQKCRQAAPLRMKKIGPVYLDYLKTLLPIELFLIPTLDVVVDLKVKLPCIDQLLALDPDLEITQSQLDHLADVLPTDVLEWTLKTMRDISSKSLPPFPVPSSFAPVTLSSPSPALNAIRQGLLPPSHITTDLATTVFGCGFERRNIVIGREVIYATQLQLSVACSERGVKAAKKIIQLENVNLYVTAAELDRQDSLFKCLTCLSPSADGKTVSDYAFTWRGCVEHFITSSSETHPEPSFQVLSSAEASTYPQRRSVPTCARYSDQQRYWMCNHCPVNHNNFNDQDAWSQLFHSHGQSWKDVEAHLRAEHGVQKPVEDVDLFFLPSYFGISHRVCMVRPVKPPVTRPSNAQASSSNAQASSSTIPPANVRCLYCKGSKGGQRLFMLDAVRAHIKAKHDSAKVQIVLGIDYEQIA
ncbi:hypothetical protein OF83DRAFT_1170230 [Amylostereum chailletii]|nr:hypothetical protein OF83DRAFT_1170230 [Amylostereum chailletii]